MELIYLESVDSTHEYLKNFVKENKDCNKLCIYTNYQINGVGSRGNSWIGKRGNLFFSFVLDKKFLPNDLLMQSASIYFSYILKIVLKNHGSNVWIKWPNDFYLDNSKIGGTITTLSNNLLYCGIGLNLMDVSEEFKGLDIKIDGKKLLIEYFEIINKRVEWKDILKEYMIEFQESQKLFATVDGKKISLSNAILNNDGSINLNGKKVYSLR